MLATKTLIDRRYEIVRLIGSGGMGAVYEAIDTRLGRRVALKQLTVSGEKLEQAGCLIGGHRVCLASGQVSGGIVARQ